MSLLGIFSKLRKPKIEQSKLPPPRHIALIMDGNGRWAKKRGLPRTSGHAVGAETLRTIATYCQKIGIEYLTVYAFSTENWSRNKNEVDTIWEILRKYLQECIERMEADRFKLRVLGDRRGMPEDVYALLDEIEVVAARVKASTTLCICLNYGGRQEILHSVQALAKECADGNKNPEDLTMDDIQANIYSYDIPDPDLIIRPSGEYRLSNFLLWQCAYSEFLFMDVLWPDFSPADIDRAIEEYHNRDRRYGGVKSESQKKSK